ncbi:hypothetical protein VPH35_026461 [Triticum aestivum]
MGAPQASSEVASPSATAPALVLLTGGRLSIRHSPGARPPHHYHPAILPALARPLTSTVAAKPAAQYAREWIHSHNGVLGATSSAGAYVMCTYVGALPLQRSIMPSSR